MSMQSTVAHAQKRCCFKRNNLLCASPFPSGLSFQYSGRRRSCLLALVSFCRVRTFSKLPGRHPIPPLEDHVKLANPFITHGLGHLQHSHGGLAQQLGGPIHPPVLQPSVNRLTINPPEVLFECRGGQTAPAAEGLDGEFLFHMCGHILPHFYHRPVQTSAGGRQGLPPSQQAALGDEQIENLYGLQHAIAGLLLAGKDLQLSEQSLCPRALPHDCAPLPLCHLLLNLLGVQGTRAQQCTQMGQTLAGDCAVCRHQDPFQGSGELRCGKIGGI